ncbi:hypothetical protein BLOT_007333 [Blomia tropicalis]|nr:hypothetical protein BLOT_007333 [Blomia tropicalis]
MTVKLEIFINANEVNSPAINHEWIHAYVEQFAVLVVNTTTSMDSELMRCQHVSAICREYWVKKKGESKREKWKNAPDDNSIEHNVSGLCLIRAYGAPFVQLSAKVL